MARVFRIAAGILGWLVLALQYGLVMAGDLETGPIARTINFFSYFTILTNILVALAFTLDRKSTRLNSSHIQKSRMPSSA